MWAFLGRGHFSAYKQMYGLSWSCSGWLDIVFRLKWLLLSSVMLLPCKHVFQLLVIVLSACSFTSVPTFTGLQALPPPTYTTSSPHLWGTLWECLLLPMADHGICVLDLELSTSLVSSLRNLPLGADRSSSSPTQVIGLSSPYQHPATWVWF